MRSIVITQLYKGRVRRFLLIPLSFITVLLVIVALSQSHPGIDLFAVAQDSHDAQSSGEKEAVSHQETEGAEAGHDHEGEGAEAGHDHAAEGAEADKHEAEGAEVGHDHAAEGAEAGHDHEAESAEGEAHAHSEAAGETGVVEVPPEMRTPLGLKVEPTQKGKLALTLDLYGWVRPRPSDVTDLRAPVPAMVNEIHVQQGQMVEVGQPLVTLVVPSALDWQKTILAAFNEKTQLTAAHDLLVAEGESKVVQLLGEIRVAAAERERLSDEVTLLDKAGSEAIARRDVNVKRGELKSAVATLDAKRALALAYGLDPEFTKKIEAGEINIQVPQGALPPEIRRQLQENDYKGIVANNDAQAAAQNLTSLGFNHGLVGELSKGNLSRLTDKLVLTAGKPGLVTGIQVTRQSSLNAAEAILRIMDYRTVYVEAEVAESDISRVLARSSDQMLIRFTGLDGQAIEGHVAFFDTTIEPDVRKAHLVLEVQNLEGLPLREHMAASVSVPLEVHEDILSVPKASLVTDSFQRVVFVDEGEHFRKRVVKTGIQNSESVEILEGLKEGDPVVVSGARVLLLALSTPKGGGDAHAGHNH